MRGQCSDFTHDNPLGGANPGWGRGRSCLCHSCRCSLGHMPWAVPILSLSQHTCRFLPGALSSPRNPLRDPSGPAGNARECVSSMQPQAVTDGGWGTTAPSSNPLLGARCWLHPFPVSPLHLPPVLPGSLPRSTALPRCPPPGSAAGQGGRDPTPGLQGLEVSCVTRSGYPVFLPTGMASRMGLTQARLTVRLLLGREAPAFHAGYCAPRRRAASTALPLAGKARLGTKPAPRSRAEAERGCSLRTLSASLLQ